MRASSAFLQPLVFVQAAELDVLAMHPSTTTLHNLFDPDRLSDHSAISCVFTIKSDSSRSPANSAAIPKWIYQHPDFPDHFHRAFADTGYEYGGTPYEHVAVAKDALQVAAITLRKSLAATRAAKTVQEKQYWAAAAWRAGRQGNSLALRRAVKAHPDLEAAVDLDTLQVNDWLWLRRHIAQLHQAALEEAIAEVVEGGDESTHGNKES